MKDAAPMYYVPLGDSPPPTDSLPEIAPPWLTPADLGQAPSYRAGLRCTTTGYKCLDLALRGGFRAECLYVIAGRTGNGKTTITSNIARCTALAGETVLLFKLEESPREALWRIHSAAAQVEFRKLLDGNQDADLEERSRLADAWEMVRELPIRLSACRELDGIQRIARAHAEQGGGLIIVDQLSMIRAGGNVGYERATIASNALRQLAVELQVPILLVCQVNRAAAKDEKPLTCHDLRDSGEIENDATAVLLLDKPRSAAQSWAVAPFLYLDVAVGKHRYGPLTEPDKPIVMTWFPLICRIEEGGRR